MECHLCTSGRLGCHTINYITLTILSPGIYSDISVCGQLCLLTHKRDVVEKNGELDTCRWLYVCSLSIANLPTCCYPVQYVSVGVSFSSVDCVLFSILGRIYFVVW